MLDSLGSTLSAETVNSFFTCNGSHQSRTSLPSMRPYGVWTPNEKKRVVFPAEEGGSILDLSTPGGMGIVRSLSTQAPPQLGKLDFSGPPMHLLEGLDVSPDDGALKVTPPPQSAYPMELSHQPLAEAAASVGGAVQKHAHRPTPPANPQVPPLTLKSPSAQTQAQAPKSA